MTIEKPDTWLAGETASRPLTVLVFFRGSWCPFCQAYLREMNGDFLRRVRGAGGELFAVTAHSSEGAEQTRREGELGYEVLSDPSNTLARRFDVAITPKAQSPLAEHPTEYPHGMAQPAVIALDGKGTVLFRWAIDPSTTNLGGASDRPLPLDMWRVIEAALAGETKPLTGETRLDPDYLAKHYPAQHATFEAWVASASQKG